MSWCTGLELPPADPEQIVQRLSQCGIPNSWITQYSVVMRCQPAKLKSGDFLRVPTVIDAFDLEIFHPTADSRKPGAGVAIHLQRSGTLQEGAKEFILQPLVVEEIEVCPVEITDRVKTAIGVPLDTVLRGSLLDYYTSL
jgi:hypothetical protein